MVTQIYHQVNIEGKSEVKIKVDIKRQSKTIKSKDFGKRESGSQNKDTTSNGLGYS